jgi:hypothetical protein
MGMKHNQCQLHRWFLHNTKLQVIFQQRNKLKRPNVYLSLRKQQLDTDWSTNYWDAFHQCKPLFLHYHRLVYSISCSEIALRSNLTSKNLIPDHLNLHRKLCRKNPKFHTHTTFLVVIIPSKS